MFNVHLQRIANVMFKLKGVMKSCASFHIKLLRKKSKNILSRRQFFLKVYIKLNCHKVSFVPISFVCKDEALFKVLTSIVHKFVNGQVSSNIRSDEPTTTSRGQSEGSLQKAGESDTPAFPLNWSTVEGVGDIKKAWHV